jgi:hypothetical protein
MSRLNWFVARKFDRFPVLTLISWLSVALLIAVLIWFLIMVKTVPTSDQSESQEVAKTTIMAETPESPVNTVLSSAPEVKQVTYAIETLFSIASKHQLKLEEVMYQSQDTKKVPLLIYAIDFSVEQRYPRIKAFITDLLQALPYLALEQVSFEREEIRASQIRSDLRFILFMEKEHE